MANSKVSRLLFAYFEQSKREYARAVISIRALGGLNREEIETIRDKVPLVHAETIIRHVTMYR